MLFKFIYTSSWILNISFHAGFFLQEFCRPFNWNIFWILHDEDCILSSPHVSNRKHWFLPLHHAWNWLTEQQMCMKELWQNLPRIALAFKGTSQKWKKAPMDKSRNVFFYLFITFMTKIGSQGSHTNCVTICIFKFRGNVWKYWKGSLIATYCDEYLHIT